MALLGGGVGGAGNPVGGSYTGPAEALEYTGRGENGGHVYAFSGVIQVATSNVTQLSFTTGSGYISGHVTCYGSVDDSNPDLGGTTAFTISFNGSIAFKIKTDTLVHRDSDSVRTVPVIIPPYTEVLIEADSGNADAGLRTAASITGIIYK